MVKATWNGVELAKSENTIVVEGNQYFPKDEVDSTYLEESDYHTRCHWKGLASYYHVIVEGKKNENAAWYYPEPLSEATHIKNYIAFWKGVEVSTD